MKTHLYPLGLSVSLLLLGGALPAAPESAPGLMYPVTQVWCANQDYFQVGAFDIDVSRNLGTPLSQPATDVWIYRHRFSADLEEANRAECHNLMVTFRDRRVTSIRLIDDKAVKVVTAMIKEKGAIALPPTVFLTSK